MNNENSKPPVAVVFWETVAVNACRMPMSPVRCPACGEDAVACEWNLVSARSRQAVVDMHCAVCEIRGHVQILLPDDAPACYPMERLPLLAEAIAAEAEGISARVRRHVEVMPAAAFTTHPLWAQAGWSATTFQWHPTSEAPPVMGLVFDNAEMGLEIFREAERQMNHEDRFEEIRIAIIEGAIPGLEQQQGYSVHICADPDALCAHATMEDFVVDQSIIPFLGQWNRHYPIPDTPPLLPRFKREFLRHQEFMLAPTIRREDGNLYMVPELGIVKNVVHFRQLEEITTPEDTDVAALLMPHLIVPSE